ncbi:MAG: formate dehydrogenase subunit alpha [Hydrogenophilales bacterium]|nr:formate dehydrogenase subunit alpha [Hydrogenophilales bacterium]
MSPTLCQVSIDGEKISVPVGTSILQAAQQLGIDIPTLCFDPLLTPEGVCRLCCVEIDGMHGLVSSCTTAVHEGMQVHTTTDKVRENQRQILRMVLQNFGTAGRNDPAQAHYATLCRMAEAAGLSPTDIKTQEAHYLTRHDPLLAISPERCIQCNLCFRYCEYLHGFHPSEILDMGGARQLSFAMGMPLAEGQCDHCGGCVDHCPTGALVEKWRVTHGPADYQAPSICTYCGTGCALQVQVKDGVPLGAQPVFAKDSVNQGQLCVKGRFGLDFVSHPDRITQPLIREREGRTLDCFRAASWDEALDYAAREFKLIRDQDGGDKLAVLSSARATNEENYLAQKFARAVFNTNNIDNCARICHAPSVAGLTAAFGSGAATNSLDEIEGADCILLIGANPTEAHPVIGHKIKHAVRHKHAKLIVIDPRTIWLTQIADVHLQLRAGSNIALLNGILRALIEENLIDAAFIAARTSGFEATRKIVMDYYGLDHVQSITGVAQEDIRRAARLYANAKNGMIIYGLGITQHIHGSSNVMAIANLALATGHIGRKHAGVCPLRGQNNVQGACDVGALPNVLPGYQKLNDPSVIAKFSQHWQVALPTSTGLKSCQMIHGAKNGQVKGLYLIAEDPVQTDPDSHLVAQAMDNLDCLVVQELFFTRTASFADVILPAACALEKEGTFTNTDRRIQHFKPVLPAPGECRTDMDIICDLAGRMGYAMHYDGPAQVWEELAELSPILYGVRYARLTAGEQLVWPCPTQDDTGQRTLHENTFTRGKGVFHALEFEPPEESVDAAYPYLLTTGRRLEHYCNGAMTRKTEGLMGLYSHERIEINPEDAEKLSLQEEDWVEVKSRRGQIKVNCHITPRCPPGTVFMSFHFSETPVNILTGSYYDPIAITPEYKVTAVDICKVG